MIIDATNLILGRLASYAAQKALLGEKVDIVNCEYAIVTGNKANIIAHYMQKIHRGIPLQGPYFPKQSDRIVRRTIRGMLPHKQAKGRDVYKNVMCYLGVPEDFKGKKLETIEAANIANASTLRYIPLKEIAKHIGGKA
ncbi:50S ribosomal protein L13 [Candidatus Woesearchaeota archaeon]|nr:50S ribosomal protein L13 [Candidatus Woesearchaeota archaeon]